jgi:hypothetical protein
MSGSQGRPRKTYAEHQAEHAAELQRIRAAAGLPARRSPQRRAARSTTQTTSSSATVEPALHSTEEHE